MMITLLMAVTTVAGVLDANRQMQGNDASCSRYTEIEDDVLNRVFERDRELDDKWMAAAKDPAALRRLQGETRMGWIRALGGFPERCPLNTTVTGVVKRDGYRIEKTMFESRPHHHVTATVFVPESPEFKAPYPAVAVGCGHTFTGKMCNNYQRPGVIGAKNGFVVVVYDPIDQGERLQRRDAKRLRTNTVSGHNHIGYRAMLLGWNTAQFRIWDGMRAIDMLCEREDVDRTRIAVTGHSGGGTESAYLMALDDRVMAAAPSGFITTIRDLAYLCGPQDAEQKFFGQLQFNLNHLGILMMRADACAELPLATHADFFPYIGASETAAKAKAAYAAMGRKGAFDFIHASGPHLWPESSMQMEYRWFRHHLTGEDCWRGYDAIREQRVNFGFSYDDPAVDTGLMRLPENERKVTPSGNVVDLEGERTVYDVMRDELRSIDGGRGSFDRETVARLAGIRTSGCGCELLDRHEYALTNGVSAVTMIAYREDGMPVPVSVFKPAVAGDGQSPVLFVSDALYLTNHTAKIEGWLAQGRTVVIAELRNFGLTGRAFRPQGENIKGKFYSCPDVDEMTAVMLEWLGESLVGRRAEDLMAVAKAMRRELGGAVKFALECDGRAAVSAAHAYYLDRGTFASFNMTKAPSSWRGLFADDTLPFRFSECVFGALRRYDWVDLIK